MKIYKIEPPESVADIDVGQVFKRDGDDKLYILIHRDIVRCLVRRWTWWDKVKVHVLVAALKLIRFYIRLKRR